jgi:hypothetical protein
MIESSFVFVGTSDGLPLQDALDLSSFKVLAFKLVFFSNLFSFSMEGVVLKSTFIVYL